MNEIIAVIFFVMHGDKVLAPTHLDPLSPEEIASSPERVAEYLHDERHLTADIYAVFERIMNLGLKELFMQVEDL